MPNRLANATSPYLLQHQDNPVDWWEWGEEAFAEARRAQRAGAAERRVRRLPLVPRDGARVVRGRGDRGVHERALREHQGRPRGAARRRRGLHAGDRRDDRAGRLADDVRARPRGQPVLRRHLLPGPAAARAAELPAAARGDRRRVDQPRPTRWPTSAARIREALDPVGRALAAGWPSTEAALDAAVDHAAARLRRRLGRVRQRARSSRRRWCSSSCCGRELGGDAATQMAGKTLAGDGGRRDPRPARRRVRALRRRPGLGGAALREDALRQRAAALGLRALGRRATTTSRPPRSPSGSPTSCSPSCGTAEGAFASALDADSEGEEGTFYVWTPAQLVEVLGPDDGAWAATLLTVTERGTFEHGTSTLQLPTQPDDPARWESVRARLLEARVDAGAARPRRQGGRRLERAGDQRAWSRRARCSATRTLRRRRGAVRRVPGRRTPAGRAAAARLPRRRRRLARRRARGPRLRRERLPRARLRHRRRRLGRARRAAARRRARALRRRGRRLPRHRRRRRGAAGPAARPVGQRQPERPLGGGPRAALVRRPHRVGPPPRRRRAGPARLAAGSPTPRPRFAGWSLAAAETALDGPVEVAVVGPAGRRARRPRARRPPPRAARLGGRGRRARGRARSR